MKAVRFHIIVIWTMAEWMNGWRPGMMTELQSEWIYPPASRRGKGQWLWAHRERIYKDLSAKLFSMLVQLSLLPFIANTNQCFESLDKVKADHERPSDGDWGPMKLLPLCGLCRHLYWLKYKHISPIRSMWDRVSEVFVRQKSMPNLPA